MITAQDIREKGFEKAKIGGYAMNEVDDFLDALADDVAASQKETNVLKAKMKVLVGKIEEYRGSEEAMHRALVAAQKIAQEVEDEARAKADAIVADAQAEAERLVAEAQAEADRIAGDVVSLREKEEARYAAAKSSAAEYLEGLKKALEKEQKYLDSLEADFDLAWDADAETTLPEEPVEELDATQEIGDDLRAFMDAVYEKPAESEEEELLF